MLFARPDALLLSPYLLLRSRTFAARDEWTDVSVQAGRGYALSASPGKENGPGATGDDIAQYREITCEFVQPKRYGRQGDVKATRRPTRADALTRSVRNARSSSAAHGLRVGYFFFAGLVDAPPAVPLKGFGGIATPRRAAAEVPPFAFEPFVLATGAAATGAEAAGDESTGSALDGGGESPVGGAADEPLTEPLSEPFSASFAFGFAAAVVAPVAVAVAGFAADAVAVLARGSSAVPNATSAAVATTTAAAINATPRRAASRGCGAISGSVIRERFIGRGGGNDAGA